MSSIIQTLPQDAIALIAAGEIIDSLAAVVRELIENALDAEATRITVSLMPELWWIQVADNGKGMSLEDLKICTTAHSTSKIFSREDLWRIKTLGFRGEALHSLTQVAELEILSRSSNEIDAVGWRIVYQQDKPRQAEMVAIAPGTIVTVSNLFANLPVRRRSLLPFSKQLKSVQKVIQHFALCHPQVTWQVKQNERLWFNLSPGTNAHSILPQIVKRVSLSDLQYLQINIPAPEKTKQREIKVNKTDITLSQSQINLILGLPDRCHRHQPDWVKVAVNGRIIYSPELEQAILGAMARTLPRDRYPVCFLHLQIDPAQVDWNRHPAKKEIYLNAISYWQEEIVKAIAKALQLSNTSFPATFTNKRLEKLLKVSEAKGAYNLSRDLDSPLQEAKTNKNENVDLLELLAVAQVNKTYIVAEHPHGLWLIEQHIAHERVLYEQLQNSWELVTLETPIILDSLIPSQLEQLDRLNIQIESFGENLWAARNAPAMLASRDDCAEALIELSWGGDLQTAQVATACRSAIRNGTFLSLPEMQNLLDQWKITRNPRTCPHGRPIYLSLEESALARFFRRHWVIGKSHGI